MKHKAKSKYPVDGPLTKALRSALKVSEADPYHARIVRQEALDLLEQRGAGPGRGGAGLLQQVLNRAWWILRSALSIGTMAADYREGLADCAHFFDADRLSVQDERAVMAKAFIRERFARTGKVVAASVIAKQLQVTRHIVITYIYPRLHQDKGLACTGCGPAGGWKPVA